MVGGGDQGRTLRQILWEAERAGFVGRESELDRLDAILRAVEGAAARHVWLQGVAGVGKSALLRVLVHRARSRSLPVLHIEGVARPNRVAASLQELARDLRHSMGMPVLATPAALAAGIQSAGWPWHSPLLVAVDDADRLTDSEFSALADLLRPLTVGVCVVWAACRPRPRLWATALPVGVSPERCPLDGLAPEQAQALVERDGVRLDATVVHAASAGNPRLLARAASLFEEPGAPRTPREREAAVVSLLVEQWLNPGSRRLAWRAGVGQAGTSDTVLAAAAILGPCDRHSLSQVLGGGQVSGWWPRLARLPFFVRRPTGYELDAALADYVGTEVRRRRPWAVRHWQVRAVQTACAADRAVAWRESLVRAARWWSLLPAGGPGDPLATLTASRAAPPAVAAGPAASREGLLVAVTDAGVVVRPAGPGCAACSRRMPLPDGARPSLEAHALVGPALRAYGPHGAGGVYLCSSPREPQVAGGLPCGLVGRHPADLAGLRRLVWAAQSEGAPFAARLGFRSLGREAGAALYGLDLQAVGRPWSSRLPDPLAPAPPPEAQAAAVCAALAAADDPLSLLATTVAAYGVEAFRLRNAMEIRRWLHDMLVLAAADGSLPSVDAALLQASLGGPAADAVPAAVRLYRTRKAASRFAALLFA